MLASLLEELFELSDVILIELDDDALISARRSAELIVRDFKAVDRVDDEALAALADWITDAIYFANLDLAMVTDDLRLAAQRLIDEWEGGDVAGALQSLKSAVAFFDRSTRGGDA